MLREFIKALANASFQSFDSLPRYRAVPADHYMRLILDIAPDFKPDINIGAAGVSLGLEPTITEMGLCYSFNSKVAIYNSPKYVFNSLSDLMFFLTVLCFIIILSSGTELLIGGIS